MKRTRTMLTALLLIALIITPMAAQASVSALLTKDNPIPDIYDAISPSVVAIVRVSHVWDAATDAVTTVEEGSGSAVYIDERGYFLTNHHIVEECDELEIRDADGNVYEAYVVGSDEAFDIAVVEIVGEFAGKPITIGSSDTLRVGEVVLAIGTPLDTTAMYNTLTVGFVSGLNRVDADPESTRAVGLIQTDCAINPGNSGGALVNLKGEMVGIPFMKYMGYSTGANYYGYGEIVVYEGIGFAVPISDVWEAVTSIIEKGSFVRPRFGVSVLSIDGPEEPLKNYPPAGLQIQDVEKGGSGFKAGLRVNDVITHVNGTRVYDFREYTKIVDLLAPNEAMTLTIARYNDEKGEALRMFEVLDVEVTLEIID